MDYQMREAGLLALTGMSASSIIEGQEAQGQRQLVNSTQLPIQHAKDWEILKSWGVVKGENVDDLFCTAELPPGWSKQATDHSMWNNLVDERGLKRASFFYKAAFYDRDAFLRANANRFTGASVGYRNEYHDLGAREVPAISDNGLERIVAVFEPIYYAYLSDLTVGAIMGGDFYWDVAGDYSSAQFTKVAPVDEVGAIRLVKDEFYDRFHNRDVSRHDVISAIDNMTKRVLESALKDYPAGDEQWNEEYDFPAVI